jgi:hypothetical protein
MTSGFDQNASLDQEDRAEEEVTAEEAYTERGVPDIHRRHRRILTGMIVSLIGGLIFVQFLPLGISRDNPPVVAEITWDSMTTEALARRACYDCHSNESFWPWYSYIAPVSWMVVQDVVKGREVLNFSEWSAEQAAAVKVEDAVELVSKGLMPLPYYEILHPEARLSANEEGRLITGLINTLSAPGVPLDTENLSEND